MPFPSRTLVLHDSTGAPFGFLRIAPREPESPKWDGIFDISLDETSDQARRSEVRWLAKRGFVRCGEHKVALDADTGAITIRQGNFEMTLDPTEAGYRTRAPAPPVLATWQAEAPQP